MRFSLSPSPRGNDRKRGRALARPLFPHWTRSRANTNSQDVYKGERWALCGRRENGQESIHKIDRRGQSGPGSLRPPAALVIGFVNNAVLLPPLTFCWTEAGACYVGSIQSLLASCRLHAVDPYVYLVDVLQRIDTHPAFEVHVLTPRLWKQHCAANPLRSALELSLNDGGR
jgi:transposase IS66-like protein